MQTKFEIAPILVLLALFFVPATPSYCAIHDLGVYGPVYEIAEADIRELFNKGVAQVFSPENRRQAMLRFREKLKTFDLKIPQATENRSWIVDTTFKVTADIKDHTGQVVASKGTYNLLDYLPMPERTYVFIDANDLEQIEFLYQFPHQHPLTVMLTAGDIVTFYQYGFQRVFHASKPILDRFGISAVPAIVEIAHNRVLGKEVQLSDAETR